MEEKTILTVDDTATNLDILSELLDAYDILEAISGADALELVKEEKIDLILLDIMMPNMDGYEVCRNLKANPQTKDIPIIFITAKTDEESIEKAYDMGGADYVTKPFRPKELLKRVETQLKLRSTIEKLELLASTDPLTKLYNRRHFSQMAEYSFNLAKREQQNLSLLMLDIDKFKNVNDTYGHKVGDNVIIALANKLLVEQRKSDISCRYGGEEFVLLLPNTSMDGAKKVAELLRAEMENLAIITDDKQVVQFTISVGVSQVDFKNDGNIEAGLKRADDALYEAKESGRNRVCLC